MSNSQALRHIRICDFTGQLAGAGATRFLAAFGAQIIRIEDPVNEGRWDILRGIPPFIPGQRGLNVGGAFNNHNVEKLGITLNLRTEKGRDLLRRLVAVSDVVAENFSYGVLERWGFGYEQLQGIRNDIIYVSNCGFGHTGPYRDYKTWGPIVQAVSGLTFSSGLPGQPPAGWGYSYMDHTGAYYMCIAILFALHHRNRTGEGQWVDMACTEAAATLNGPALLDYTVNGRPLRRPGMPNSNRNQFPPMAPHGVYRAAGEDYWVGISCRNDREWQALTGVIAEPWCGDKKFVSLEGRIANEDALDAAMEGWTSQRDPFATAALVRGAGVPAEAVQKPEDRIERDANTSAWRLWPEVQHREMGAVRVDGVPVHLSRSDWHIERGGPCLGEHNETVLRDVLGVSAEEIASLRAEGVI
jgi:crotonobetainyl-CoA:carnitine CoA-transferase CaiB-like acyl-CoA transferase